MKAKFKIGDVFNKVFPNITLKKKSNTSLFVLPNELLMMILSYLRDNPQALFVVSLSCKNLYRLASDNSHWSPFLLRGFQQEENAKHAFFNDMNKVQSKYLTNSMHPQFRYYKQKLTKILKDEKYLISHTVNSRRICLFNIIFAQYRKSPESLSNLAITVLIKFDAIKDYISKLDPTWNYRRASVFMRQVIAKFDNAARYSLLDDHVRERFIQNIGAKEVSFLLQTTLRFPDLCQQVLHDEKISNDLRALNGADYYFPEIEHQATEYTNNIPLTLR